MGENSAFSGLVGFYFPKSKDSTTPPPPFVFLTEQVTEDVKPQEKEEEKGTAPCPVAPIIPSEKYRSFQSNAKSKPRRSYKPTRAKAEQHVTKDVDKESRHPFAMYGSGERQADMASKRTHNVGPAASTKEVSCSSAA